MDPLVSLQLDQNMCIAHRPQTSQNPQIYNDLPIEMRKNKNVSIHQCIDKSVLTISIHW